MLIPAVFRTPGLNMADPVSHGHPINAGCSHWLLSLPAGGVTTFRNLNTTHGDATVQAGFSSGIFGTLTPRWAGQQANPVLFDGSSNLTVAGAYSRVLGLSRVTLAAWVYLPAYNYGFDFGWGGTNQRFGLQANVGAWYAITYTGSGEAYTNGTTSLTGWQHVVMVFDGTQSTAANRIALYINGVKQSPGVSGTPPTTVQTPSTQTYLSLGVLGSYTSQSDTALDDFRLYPGVALSVGQVADLYEASRLAYPTALRRSRRRVSLYSGTASTTPVTDTDAGTLAESAALAASLTGTDAAALAEAAALAAVLDGTEGGTVSETVALAAALATTDAGTFAESVVLVVALATTDAGSLNDAGSVESFTGATDSDTGTLAQATALAAALAGSDAVALTEAGSIAVALAGADTGTLTEMASVGGPSGYGPTYFDVMAIDDSGDRPTYFEASQ